MKNVYPVFLTSHSLQQKIEKKGHLPKQVSPCII